MAIRLQPLPILNFLTLAMILSFCGLGLELFFIYSTKRTRKVEPEGKTRRRQTFYRVCSLALIWAGSVATFTAAVLNTEVGKISDVLSVGAVTRGVTSLALHWIAWVTSFLLAVGLTQLRRTRTSELFNI